MFDKLDEAQLRMAQISERLMEPDAAADLDSYRALMKEYKNLEPVVETYKQYKAARNEFDEAKRLLDEGGLDPDFKEMVQEQYTESRDRMESVAEELKILLLPRDPNDDKNVVVEIRGGAGGEEAALFAGSLYRMYSMYAESKGWHTELMNANETELGGFKEVSFLIEGDGAYSKLKYESGVHRVQRVPDTEASGRIHTSTVTVAVLPEVEEVELEILPTDLQIDTYRSGGAGGQHVNKTESAIRITCPPASSSNVRTSAANTRTRTRPCACCAPGCMSGCSRSRTTKSRANAAPRSARATAANASAPIISPRDASPTTASG